MNLRDTEIFHHPLRVSREPMQRCATVSEGLTAKTSNSNSVSNRVEDWAARRSSSDARESLATVARAAAGTVRCPLCMVELRGVDSTSSCSSGALLAWHLDTCDANTVSCPHCHDGVAAKHLQEHIEQCPRNARVCYVCQCVVPAAALAVHLKDCGRGRVIRMYHGTSLDAARSILREGFRPSTKGLLGSGVYVTKDPTKARQYGDVIVECDVHVGAVAVIDRKHHPLQKCWAAHGYDAAWIPPTGGTSAATVGASGLEEHCVGDPRRVIPVAWHSSMSPPVQ